MGRKSGAGPLGLSTLGLTGRPSVGGGSGPGLALGLMGQGLGRGEAQPQRWLSPRDKGSFGLNYWGVLPPAHHDAKSERGIVCLDAGCCVHACVHGRHGPLMSQKRALQRPWGRGERGWVPGGLGAWVRGNCGRVCVFLGVVSATGCLDCVSKCMSPLSRIHVSAWKYLDVRCPRSPLSTSACDTFVHVRV